MRRGGIAGFTLVELAIVLTIVGLLIGGVMQGQKLIRTARINATIAQVNAYKAATLTFQEKYGALPGDLVAALTRIPGCNTGNYCRNGNGNNRIGTPVNLWEGGQHAVTTENTQFWKHLALDGIVGDMDPTSNEAAWGKTLPRSKLDGGYTIVESIAGGADSLAGLVLRLQLCADCANIEGTAAGQAAATPGEAAMIDRKMDDGNPGTGSVIATEYMSGQGCQGAYQETRDEKNCIVSFQLLQ